VPIPLFILPPLHAADELASIIKADYELNHAQRDYSCDTVEQRVTAWLVEGKPLFCAERCAFILEEKSTRIVEFHSINGGTAKQLTAGVQQLLDFVAPYYPYAVTYYDNPRVNDLLKHVSYHSQPHRIDDGEDRTWEAIFYLRSK
jgi:hypothetical protein